MLGTIKTAAVNLFKSQRRSKEGDAGASVDGFGTHSKRVARVDGEAIGARYVLDDNAAEILREARGSTPDRMGRNGEELFRSRVVWLFNRIRFSLYRQAFGTHGLLAEERGGSMGRMVSDIRASVRGWRNYVLRSMACGSFELDKFGRFEAEALEIKSF